MLVNEWHEQNKGTFHRELYRKHNSVKKRAGENQDFQVLSEYYHHMANANYALAQYNNVEEAKKEEGLAEAIVEQAAKGYEQFVAQVKPLDEN